MWIYIPKSVFIEFEHRHKRFLRNFDRAELTHTLFALFLFFEKLLFTGYVAPVTFRKNVFSPCLDGFAGNDFAADTRLDGNFEKLTGNVIFQFFCNFSAACICTFGIYYKGKGIDDFAVKHNVEFYELALFITFEFIVKGGVTSCAAFECVEKVVDYFVKGHFVMQIYAVFVDILHIFENAAAVLAKIHYRTRIIVRGYNVGVDYRLFRFQNVVLIRICRRVVYINDLAVRFRYSVNNARSGGYKVEIIFSFKAFLDYLHMEIIQERLEREYNLDLITTAPSVVYRITKTDGEVVYIDNPTAYPNQNDILKSEEPIVNADIITPNDYTGTVMDLCQNRRGVFKNMQYIDENRVNLHYEMPLNEIIYDFFDALKSRTRGYASFDYEFKGYKEGKLVKLDIMLNGEIVDALSFIVNSESAYARGRKIAEKLKDNIPRQLFEVPVQACIGGKIIARETVKAWRKDVLAKCYGGDITRKKKLLEKQKEGKKRMRKLGSVEVPQEAFMAVLKLDED